MMEKTARIEWVDYLKGVAILWLMLYHMHVFEGLRSPVPIFFFLSGLFFSEGKSFGLFVKKKSKALLVPFLFFFMLGIITAFAGAKLTGENYAFPKVWQMAGLLPINTSNPNPLGVGAIWFLLSLFEIYIANYLIRVLSKSKWWSMVVSTVLLLLSALLLQKYAFGSLFYLIYSGLFLIIFVVAHVYKEEFLHGELHWWLPLLSIGAYLISYIVVDNSSIGGGILLVVRDLISSMGLTVFFVWLFRTINDTLKGNTKDLLPSRFLLFEGRNSLTILGVHMLAQGIVGVVLKHVISTGFLYYFILFLVQLLLCNICIVVFNRFVPFLVNHSNKR